MDLCTQFFPHVTAYFMYLVKGLEFQEAILRHYERRYGIEVLRVPHFMLSEWLRYGTFRMPDFDVPIISTKELYDYTRDLCGTWWIACGERISDSIIRRAMIKHSGTIDNLRGRIYPIAYWRKAEIMYYVRRKHLRLSLENTALGFSFRSLMPTDMQKIKDRFPSDYEKIIDAFPLVEVSRLQEVYREEGCNKHESIAVSEGRGNNSKQK